MRILWKAALVNSALGVLAAMLAGGILSAILGDSNHNFSEHFDAGLFLASLFVAVFLPAAVFQTFFVGTMETVMSARVRRLVGGAIMVLTTVFLASIGCLVIGSDLKSLLFVALLTSVLSILYAIVCAQPRFGQ